MERQVKSNIWPCKKKLIHPYDMSELSFIVTGNDKIVAEIFMDGEITRDISLSINGISYQRENSSIKTITAERILDKIKNASPQISQVSQAHIADLAIRIEDLNKRLSHSYSWKSEISDWIMGSVFGVLHQHFIQIRKKNKNIQGRIKTKIVNEIKIDITNEEKCWNFLNKE